MEEVVARCPWCSSPLPDPAATACPTCAATLVAVATDAPIPGVTTISPEAIVRSKPVRRSRLLAWISGEVSDDVTAPRAPEGALAPPPDSVRLEILRLEREAALARGELPVVPAASAAEAPEAEASAAEAPAAEESAPAGPATGPG